MDFQGYLAFLRQLGERFADYTQVEREKLRAVQSGDLLALDGCIRREQAMGLTLRGMERRREEWLRALDLPDGALRRLPELCPPELRQEATRTVEDVLRQYQVLRSTRESARTLLECALHKVERTLREKGAEPEDMGEDAAPPPNMRTDFRA